MLSFRLWSHKVLLWVVYRKQRDWESKQGGSSDPNFFLKISFSWVKMSFHVEFHLPVLPGSALKVCVVGGWWWVVFDSEFSVSFGPKLQFRLWIWTWTKLNNYVHCNLYIVLYALYICQCIICFIIQCIVFCA